MDIDPVKGWYSAQELAGMPGMPGTDRGVNKAAQKNLWKSRTKERGKGAEYSICALPVETRSFILGKAFDLATTSSVTRELIDQSGLHADEVKSVIVLKPGVVVIRGQQRHSKERSNLSDKDINYNNNALILCRAIEGAIQLTNCSITQACHELAVRLINGNVCADLLAAAVATYLKPRKGAKALGGVSAQTDRLQRMMAFFEEGRKAGNVGMYLYPGRRQKEERNPIHVTAFLRFFCVPARPSIREAYRKMVPWLNERGLDVPSYWSIWRLESELPMVVKYRGRMTGSEWRSLKSYVERDVSMFHSNDIWVGDGHSFKAKVQHPVHGQPFTPEVTIIIDWVSRKIVGWSVSLAESTVAVSDAFRHAQITTRARPLVYYSDNGSGQTGKMIDCPIAGTLARQCIAHETGVPGNPQARGVIERIWQSTLIPLAREYPSCIWRGADKNTTVKILKLLKTKDCGGVAIPSFSQFLEDVNRVVNEYNLNHKHSKLNGNTPEDEYQERIDKDSIVFGPSNDEIVALWMPEVIRTPARGVFQFRNNLYVNNKLPELLPEGSKVRVRYDLHNAEKVELLTLDGTYLGEAIWNGNRVAAFPVAEMDRMRAERAAGRVKRGEQIISEAQAELGDICDLVPAESVPVSMPDFLPIPEEEINENNKEMSHEEMVMWLFRDEGKQAGDSDADD